MTFEEQMLQRYGTPRPMQFHRSRRPIWRAVFWAVVFAVMALAGAIAQAALVWWQWRLGL